MNNYNSVIVSNTETDIHKKEISSFSELDILNGLETFKAVPASGLHCLSSPIIVRIFTGGRNNEQVVELCVKYLLYDSILSFNISHL